MKYALLVMSLVSILGFIHAADVPRFEMQEKDTNLVCDADSAKLSARRLNSLMEAFMEGKFAASKKGGCLKYDDYETRASCEEDWDFEDTVKKVNRDVEAVYYLIHRAIYSFTLLDFHVILGRCKSKEEKITYLKELQEADKMHIQSIRLYDFLEGINIIKQERQKIVDDKELPEWKKAHAIRELMYQLQGVNANRLTLKQAVASGDAVQMLEACKKPLHIANFVPLNVAIAKMITDIEAGEDNVLLDNESRALQVCIIS